MDASALNLVKQRYRFEEWVNRNRLRESLFLSGYFLRRASTPEWECRRSVRLEVPSKPPCTQSIWVRPDRPETWLRAETYECASRREAHEYLAQILGQVQTSEAETPADEELGDVAFSWLNDQALAFARGNLAIVLTNAGRERWCVTEVARSIDGDVRARPPGSAASAARMAVHVRTARAVKPGVWMPLVVEVSEPRGKAYYCKFFCAGGEIARKEGQLQYQASGPGTARIVVHTVGEDGVLGHAVHRATVRQ